jgi:hypothetical protein
MRTECTAPAKTLLRSRSLGSLSLRLGCGEPLHGRLKGAAADRPHPPRPSGLERAPA